MSSPPQKKRKISPSSASSKNPSQTLSDTSVETNAKAEMTEFDPSVLIFAAKAGNCDQVKELISTDIPLNARDQNGYSALAVAAICGHKDVVNLLLEANACHESIHEDLADVKSFFSSQRSAVHAFHQLSRNLEQRNWQDMTALQWAAERKNEMLVQALLLAGASTDAGYKKRDRRPLIKAIFANHTSIVQRLVDAKARLNAVYDSRFKSLGVAVDRGHVEIVKILLAARASQTCVDDGKYTPLMVAAERGRVDIVRELLLQSKKVLNYHDSKGMTALTLAMHERKDKVVKVLLEAQAHVYPSPDAPKKSNLLNAAVGHDSLEMTKLLLAAKADPNLFADNEKPPLLLATQRKNVPIVEELLEAKADVNVEFEGSSAMSIAMEHKDFDVIKILVSAKANVDFRAKDRDDDWVTPLILAVKRRNAEVVDLLIKAHASVDIRAPNGVFPLSLAADSKNLDCLKLLIAAKARLDACDGYGYTALSAAVSKNNIAAVQELLRAGADVNQRYFSSNIALSSARTPEMVDALVAARADINNRDDSGLTPLIWATKSGRCNVVKALLKAGADVNARDLSGASALVKSLHTHWEIDSVNEGMVDALLSAKADVCVADESGRGVLLLACSHPFMNISLIKKMLESGAPVNMKDHRGRTALMRTLKDESMAVASLLISHGADLNARDCDGHTALVKAVYHGFTWAVRSLLEAKAHWDARHPAEIAAFRYACTSDFIVNKKLVSRYLRRKHREMEKKKDNIDDVEADNDEDDDMEEDNDEDDDKDEENDEEDGDTDSEDYEDGLDDEHFEKTPNSTPSYREKASHSYGDEPSEWSPFSFTGDGPAEHDFAEDDEIGQESVELIKLLISAKADMHPSPVTPTPLLLSATKRPRVLRVLVDAGAPLDLRGPDGETPLLAAAYMQARRSVEVLLQAKADVHALDYNNRTALYHAVKWKDIRTLRLLVAAGAQAETGYSTYETPLSTALKKTKNANVPDTGIVRILLEAKADVNKLVKYKTDVLKEVFSNNDLQVLKLLVNAGLDLSHATNFAAYALEHAVKDQNTKMLRLLIKAKAPVDAVNPFAAARTALTTAFGANNFKWGIVEQLLSAGARVDACFLHAGKTILFSSAVHEYPKVLRHLLCTLSQQTGYLQPLQNMGDMSDEDDAWSDEDEDMSVSDLTDEDYEEDDLGCLEEEFDSDFEPLEDEEGEEDLEDQGELVDKEEMDD